MTKSAEAIREAEHAAFVKDALQSHGGYLCKPILSIAESLEVSALHTTYFVGALVLALHLVVPAFLLPHFSALITLVPQVQNTMKSVSWEANKSSKEAKDGAQWCFYWVIYVVFELARGFISIYLPVSLPLFEFGRTLCLVICGGPWFGKTGLRPSPPSKELQEAEKAEKAKDEAKRRSDKDAKQRVEKNHEKDRKRG